jgi:tubulin monoglycylase TTLL3/8
MKQAIISTLLCTQEFIECRKVCSLDLVASSMFLIANTQSAFELYGADFMLTDDMNPWLLEVNSSPSMSQSTRATEKLVEMVLEDTLKGSHLLLASRV